ncbi:MAG: 3'(2'),5'-bisphosphate nucleotidase [Candidatus Methylomirabilales bacterium]
MGYRVERRVAVEAVRKACRLCQAVRASLVSQGTVAKADRSPVTVADFGAQAVVNLALLDAFPDDPIMAEEDAAFLRTSAGAALKASACRHVRDVVPGMADDAVLSAIDRGTWAGGRAGRYWALDPIDGTTGFLRGDQYAVALALIEDGEVVLGVLGCPNLPLDTGHPGGRKGFLFSAVKGHGTTMQWIDDPTERRIAVTEVTDPAAASFCESVEDSHSSHRNAARVASLLGMAVPPLRIDSQCKYAVLARGDVSVYLRLPTQADYEEKNWDHAAGWIIVKEAGGEVSDIQGQPLDFSLGRTLGRNRGVVATNGTLHPQVVAAVQQVLGSD